MKEKKPKKLWYATLDFRQPGKWVPQETFYLNKAYYPEMIVPTKCHVLYETPLEAFIGLHAEIMQTVRKSHTSALHVYVYSTKPTLLNRGSYYSPEMLADKEIFTFDRDLLRRHLVRQSCTFIREANLCVDYNRFKTDPLLDLTYTDLNGADKFLMSIRKPTVTMTYGSFAKYQNLSVEKAMFDLEDHPFLLPVSLKPHNPKNMEKQNVVKRTVAST